MIQAHQRRNTHERHSRRHHFYNNSGDCLRFWVGVCVDLTRKTGDSKMTVANKDGWIRHRGGKCPVEKGTRVDVRYRDGSTSANQPALEDGNPHEFWAKTWEHNGTIGDIMAYRIHTTEQKENTAMTADEILKQHKELLKCIKDNNTVIASCQADIASSNTKIDELRTKANALGFDFYDGPKEPQEDMSDPKNWRVGDRLVLVTPWCAGVEKIKGDVVTVSAINSYSNETRIQVSEIGGTYFGLAERFKFHSRPSK